VRLGTPPRGAFLRVAASSNNRIEIALPLVGPGPQAAMRLSAPHARRYA